MITLDQPQQALALLKQQNNHNDLAQQPTDPLLHHLQLHLRRLSIVSIIRDQLPQETDVQLIVDFILLEH